MTEEQKEQIREVLRQLEGFKTLLKKLLDNK